MRASESAVGGTAAEKWRRGLFGDGEVLVAVAGRAAPHLSPGSFSNNEDSSIPAAAGAEAAAAGVDPRRREIS